MASDDWKGFNDLLGLNLLNDATLWDDGVEDIAKRLGWPQESKTDELLSYRAYAFGKVSVLGTKANSLALYGISNRPAELSLVFANKGDRDGPQYVVEDPNQPLNRLPTRGAQEATIREKIRRDGATIETRLKGALGPGQKMTFGAAAGVKQRVQWWNWNGHAILLAQEDDALCGVRLVPADVAATKGRPAAKLGSKELKQTLKARVVERANGDIVLQGIPMVDQGPKGYCAPATWERYLRYVRIPADMYVLALAGQTGIGGGTYIHAMQNGVESLVRAHGREVVPLKRALDGDLLESTLRQGLPVIWGVGVDDPYYIQALNERAEARAAVSDWAAWDVSLAEFRKQDKRPQAREYHLTLIVGCNPKTREIAFSDSWGPGFEERWLTWEEAALISTGAFTIVRW